MFNSVLKLYYTSSISKDSDFYKKLYILLGYCPSKLKLYKQAFQHNSVSQTIHNNERLEYLGDAVLDLVIAELLFKKYPFQGEGFLTDMRSKSVSRKQLSTIAMDMGLQNLLLFDNSIRRNKMAIRGIAGNALEALVGAIYLDKGYKFTLNYIQHKIVGKFLDFDELKSTTVNFKSVLNQYAQKNKKELEFRVLNEEEDQKIKNYNIGVMIDNEQVSVGRGLSKKVAEQIASEKACDILGLVS